MITEESHHQRWLRAIQKLHHVQWLENKAVLKRRARKYLTEQGIEANAYRVDLTIDLAKAASLLDEYGFGIVSMKPR